MIVLVAGAGGFIGGHLVKKLIQEGHEVRAVDIKPLEEWHQASTSARVVNWSHADLRYAPECRGAVTGVDHVYNLAADMGGMGFIETHKADCMLSVLINTNLLRASVQCTVRRYFYASSACVYNADKQGSYEAVPLREEDAYPAMPEDGYGWEKLFSERMCRHFAEDKGLVTRVARFHNVYGPHGTWKGGREKAPAALSRKVIEAKRSGNAELQVWGTGHQSRTFMYIEDCLRGIASIMNGDYAGPVNLGSAELVSVDLLLDMIEDTAGTKLRRVYDPGAPRGVAGRSSDNTLFRKLYGWEPSTPLRHGIAATYHWIESEIEK
jgi:GDP-D-mannose 3',5'-epimerase